MSIYCKAYTSRSTNATKAQPAGATDGAAPRQPEQNAWAAPRLPPTPACSSARATARQASTTEDVSDPAHAAPPACRHRAHGLPCAGRRLALAHTVTLQRLRTPWSTFILNIWFPVSGVQSACLQRATISHVTLIVMP